MIASLILNILGLCGCWMLSIIGLVLSIIALAQSGSQPETARKLTLWSWICFGAGVALFVLFVLIYIVALGGSYLFLGADGSY
ncbi:hypothetical protein ACQEU5_22170 [Marinactinospora thermotolerans]|uniref:Interferon-induced transmembrane protein n=1 Tax=Marinactinospora thermotolerans DSM 45154 TaxID=1122192 RepID=A0A1T4P351_9ACTN|nr:hypothetical protein [Marinactinospora thermotolerans]SJZ85955.1 hypothetical protein SAMN02745673_01609 [Marinactinospora thermotolerans DSM 45154]